MLNNNPSTGSSNFRIFETGVVDRKQRFDYWLQATNSAFVPLEAEQLGDSAFDGCIQLLNANEIGIASVTADSQIVRRGYKQIRSKDASALIFICQTQGQGIIRQDHQEIGLSAGDFTFVDSDRPYELRFDASFEQAVMQVPKQLLIDKYQWITNLPPVKVEGREAIARIITANLKTLLEVGASLPSAHYPNIVENLVDLLTTAVGDAMGEDTNNLSRPRHMHLQWAKRYILDNLKNEKLTPQMVADACNISARYLRTLFAEKGESITGWIKMQRLESARMELESKAHAPQTISQIAYRWGFSDYTHFSRSFKAAFGKSPSHWRKEKCQVS